MRHPSRAPMQKACEGSTHSSGRSAFGRRAVLSFALASAACLSIGSVAKTAGAEGGPNAEILVVHGTQCDKPSVDPEIGEAPPLKYNCYKVLEKKQLPLQKGQASTTPLPNGRTFQVTLNDVTPEKRYKIGAAISQPDGKSFLKLADITADANKRFTVGGWAYQQGAIVLLIRVVP